MNQVNRSKTGGLLATAAVLARIAVGLVFIYMGLNKALHPVEFLKLVRQYELFSHYLFLNTIAAGLPWFEVFCGILLVAGIAVRGTAVMLILMLVPFTVLVVSRALQIADAKSIAFCAVKFDCGCGTGEVLICRKILENAVLLLLSVWLLTGAGNKLSLWYAFVRPRTPQTAG